MSFAWLCQAVPHRKTVTALLILAILAAGFTYQYLYDRRRIRYREIIAGYHRQYRGSEPDAASLNWWVTLALNRWGLERLKREVFAKP